MPTVLVTAKTFDSGALLNAFMQHSPAAVGAVASFTGLVRDYSDQADRLTALELHHYPNMTEKVLIQLAEAAQTRFNLHDVWLYHRYGTLPILDPIVLVITSSSHRSQAMAGVQFLMDCLKTDAPFWKCEIDQAGRRCWVNAKPADDAQRRSWQDLSG